MRTYGPKVEIKASCLSCQFVKSTSYVCQGDSGHDVECTYDVEKTRAIGDTTWSTPSWCPLLDIAVENLIRKTESK